MRADGKSVLFEEGVRTPLFSVLCVPPEGEGNFSSLFAFPATEPWGRFHTKDLRWGHGLREAVTAISGLQVRTRVHRAHRAAGRGGRACRPGWVFRRVPFHLYLSKDFTQGPVMPRKSQLKHIAVERMVTVGSVGL